MEGHSHILTVNAEEYFHGGALSGAVSQKHWQRLESRLEANIESVLALLAEHGATATFFVFGWSAEKSPAVVRRIVEAGHEVASRGFWPRAVATMTPEAFREDLRRTEAALLDAGAPAVMGFRSPRWITASELWALDVLLEEGYRYDASINPVFRRLAGHIDSPAAHEIRRGADERSLWELPVSTVSLFGLRIPVSGGNYLRQFPDWLMRRGVSSWTRARREPLVFYFTPWELDESMPRIGGVSRLNRIRHYRNSQGMRRVLERYMRTFRFTSVAEHLGLRPDPSRAADRLRSRGERDAPPGSAVPTRAALAARAAVPTRAEVPRDARTPVSIVVPLHDEEPTVAYLQRTIDELTREVLTDYELQVILVDDASTDGTVAELERCFGDRPRTEIVRHGTNQGVAAAIMTGIARADHEIVCSMDCDCSYDPAELRHMIPMIEGADLVTASPYHPEGAVKNVPAWRLLLSKNLSRLYSGLLRERLFTYTSCFRVYRRSMVSELSIRNGGFLGIAEILVALRLQGATIAEYPTTLECRLLGISKMRTLRAVRDHLGLLASLALQNPRRAPAELDASDRRPRARLLQPLTSVAPTVLAQAPELQQQASDRP